MFLILNLDGLGRWLAGAGIPAGGELLFFGWCLIAVLAIWMLRRLRLRQITGRTDFNQMVQLKQDDGGLRFLTNGIEYYLTWGGISQMLLEHDGVVVSAGNLFFLVPDIAFAGPGDRLAFIREVYGHLSESARSLSERHVGAALKQARAA